MRRKRPTVPVHLKCPHCGHERTRPDAPRFDARYTCPSCKLATDYRILRETWLESRREVSGAIPPLRFL